MIDDGYLECGIYEDIDIEEETITVYVKMKDDSLLPFKDIFGDPVFSNGFLFIAHDYVGIKMNSQIRESQIKYISHFRTPRSLTSGNSSGVTFPKVDKDEDYSQFDTL